jgi:VWFA-related protein
MDPFSGNSHRNIFLSANCVVLLLAICLLSLQSLAQQASPTPLRTPSQVDPDVVKISTTLVQLDVTVVDDQGRVVKDLRADEIEIYENGKKQPITNFSFVSAARPLTEAESKAAREAEKAKTGRDPAPLPTVNLKPEQVRRTIALVVDDLFLSFENAPNTRRALKKFVDEQMVDGDFVAIVRTGAGIGALQQFTSDKNILYAAIERVKWNPSGRVGLSSFGPIRPTFQELVIAEGAAEGTSAGPGAPEGFGDLNVVGNATGTMGALQFIVEGMAELPGRKSVIMFSEGWNLFNPDLLSQSNRLNGQLAKLIESANRAAVVFYPVDVRGVVYTGITAADQLNMPTASSGSILPTPQRMAAVMSQRNAALQDSQGGMDTLAKETGGFSVRNSNDLAGGIKRVLEDQSYYLVAYEPDSETFEADRRKFNKIEIKVLRKGLTARYRSGFFNVSDSTVAKQPIIESGSPTFQLQRALMSPFAVNDLSLRLNALFGNAPEGAYVNSLLHIEAKDLRFTDEPDGSKKAVFDVWAACYGDKGIPTDQIRKTYTLSVKPERYKKVVEDGFVYFFLFPVKKAGPYQYRVAIRDSQSGKIGSASQFIQIPDVKKGRLTASSILIESHLPADWAKLFDPAAGIARSNLQTDTALRTIKLGSVLQYGFEVYNAKLDSTRKPSLQSRIRVFRDGNLVLDGQPIPVNLTGQADMQRLQISGALNLLKEMQPGDYILQVIVTDSLAKKKEQVTAQHIQFEVVQ